MRQARLAILWASFGDSVGLIRLAQGKGIHERASVSATPDAMSRQLHIQPADVAVVSISATGSNTAKRRAGNSAALTKSQYFQISLTFRVSAKG
jgi:hypothetical protein